MRTSVEVRRQFPVFLLLFAAACGAGAAAPEFFQFTAPYYNLSIYENAPIGTLATWDERTRWPPEFADDRPPHADDLLDRFRQPPRTKIGVQLPSGYNQIQFKIVQGDDGQRFKATAKKLGDFAFLGVEFVGSDDILNRELREHFQFQIRAIARRKRANTLEAGCTVNLRILDENDNRPMFRQLDYRVEVDDRTPINSRLIRLNGFDADEGMNGALYYSIVVDDGQPSAAPQLFYVEPESGWVRSVGPLRVGNHSFGVRIEDRASRLFRDDADPNGAPMFGLMRNKATVHVDVMPRRAVGTQTTKVHFHVLPFEPSQRWRQLVAILKVEDSVADANQLDVRLSDDANSSSNNNNSTVVVQLERRSDVEFHVFLLDSTPCPNESTIPLSLTIVEHSFSGVPATPLLRQTFTLVPDASRRRVWFDFASNFGDLVADESSGTLMLTVSESATVGAVLEQFVARTTYPEDQHKIRYKLLTDQRSGEWNITTTASTAGGSSAANGSGIVTTGGGFLHVPFDLNYRKGQLRLKSALDFDAPGQQRRFPFRLIAELVEPPPADSTRRNAAAVIRAEHRLNILLADANDNCPQFAADALPAALRLTLDTNKPDAALWRPVVTDADSAENGALVFKVIGVNGSDNYFSVNSTSGELKLWKALPASLDFVRVRLLAMDLGRLTSHQTEVMLTVRRPNATTTIANPPADVGAPSIRSTCELRNENAPTFVGVSKPVFGVDESAEPMEIVGRVRAVDEDVNVNGLVQYSLINPDSYFGVQTYSGEIFVRRNLTELIQSQRADAAFDPSAEHVDVVLEVLARDSPLSASEALSSRQKVTVRVRGVNRHSPVFDKPSYFVRVEENDADVGREVLRVSAADADIGRNGRIRYHLAVDTGGHFSLDPESGALTLRKSYDREAALPRSALDETSSSIVVEAVEDRFTLLVMAVDDAVQNPRVAFVNVTVELTDINDNAPLCLRNVTTAYIFEDAPDGQLVTCLGAHDWDAAGPHSRLTFELVARDNDVTAPFCVDAASGCVFINSTIPLDYESRSAYWLSVRVADSGSPPLTTECALELRLVDINENVLPPVFKETAVEASVEENRPPKTEVVRVQASDPEGTLVTYRLISGSGLGHFEIDSVTGVVRTLESLDHEETAFYWLTVLAEDSGGAVVAEAADNDDADASIVTTRRLSATLHVLVRVLDVNDRAPIFGQPAYFATVLENSVENKVILKVEAMPPDLYYARMSGVAERKSDGEPRTGGPSGVKYQITRGNPQSNFAIDENTGYIVTGKRRLDRETQAEHELHVTACDHSVTSSPNAPHNLCTTAMVVVTVEDVNDCAPKFGNPSRINVPADTIGLLCRVFAADADAPGPNAAIDYRLAGGGADGGTRDSRFSIDNHGRIYTKEALKAGSQAQLRVVARDRGNPPLESNATIVLTALGRSNKFTVSNRRPRLLDAEMWRELYVSDGDAVGVIVGIVKAADDDNDPLWWRISDAGASTNPASNAFTFRAGNSGELVLAQPIGTIDATLNEISLHFSVTDGIDEVKNTIKVRISRSANTRPKFVEPPAHVELAADTPVGLVVHTASAQFDESQRVANAVSHPHRVTYAIHSVDDIGAREVIGIDASSGNLIVEKAVGGAANVARNFSVTVVAKVGGARESFARVHFYVRPINRFAPAFVADQYRFLLLSGGDGASQLGFVDAYDADPAEYGRVSYEIIGGNEAGLFSIDSASGELRRTERYDAKRPLPPESILTVRAVDAAPTPKSSTATVKLYSVKWVQNALAERRLRLIRESSRLMLDDTMPIDQLLTQVGVVATPFYSGPVIYSIHPSSAKECAQLLDVHFGSGVLRLGRYLSATGDGSAATMNCTLTATTAAEAQQSASGALQLEIRPHSWRCVHFGEAEYRGAIRENSAPQTLIGVDDPQQQWSGEALRIALRSADSTAEPALTSSWQWSVLPASIDAAEAATQAHSDLAVEADSFVGSWPLTARLRSQRSFDSEKSRYVDAFLVAQQPVGDVPQRLRYTAAPARLRVNVLDVNDVTPAFRDVKKPLTLRLPTVSDSELIGMLVGRAVADDEDTVGGPVRYALRRAEPLFRTDSRRFNAAAASSLGASQSLLRIDRNSGELRVAANDSRSFDDVHSLLVKLLASDGVHSTYANVTVNVLPAPAAADDSGADLSLPRRGHRTHVSVAENQTGAAAARELISLWPQGAKFGETYRFRILNDVGRRFVVDERSGALRTNASVALDREADDKLQVLVGASLVGGEMDGDEVVATIVTLVNVDVEDVNDCAPRFLEARYAATIPQEVNVGWRVVSVKATDADLGMSGVVRYRIEADDARTPDIAAYLEVNKYDGRVTVAKPLPPEMLAVDAEHRFRVVAMDLGSPPLESRAEVTIRVANRHRPIFASDRYRATVSEAAAAGTPVATVRATMPSGGNAGSGASGAPVIGYRIRDGDPHRHFSIDFSKGSITLNRALDREQCAEYALLVEAFDVTATRNATTVATTRVEVTVEDVNDRPPTFDRRVYLVAVSEEAAIGTRLGRLHATDADRYSTTTTGGATMHRPAEESAADAVDELAESLQDYLSYSIVSGNRSVMSIDSATGELFLAGAVDFELQRFYEYTVSVSDKDRLSSEAIVKLHVLDANDLPPSAVGVERLRLVRPSGNGSAALSQGRFLYKFSEIIDKDTVSRLPHADGALQPRFRYEITRGDETLFRVDAVSGTLWMVTADDGLVDMFAEEQQWLNVMISDGQYRVEVPVEVELLAEAVVGEVPLHFAQTNYGASVSEFRASTNRSAIVTLRALGGRPPYRYNIAGSADVWWPLAVEAESGRVVLRERLDREATAHWTVPFSVRDAHGSTAFARLELSVVDENDNEPRWVAPPTTMATVDGDGGGYALCVGADAQPGEPIAMVMAIDADEDDRLEYSVQGAASDDRSSDASSDADYLEIHPTQGFIVLKRSPFDASGGRGETGSTAAVIDRTFDYRLRVSDAGNPPHQSAMALRVRFVDAPRRVPQFSQIRYLFAISEDASPLGVVGRLQKSELTQNLRNVRFSIISSTTTTITTTGSGTPAADAAALPFALNSTSGDLILIRSLDFERRRRYDFVAEISTADRWSAAGGDDASDAHGERRLSSFAIVTISVIDVNDNAPVFRTVYERIDIMESVAPRTVVAVFEATDSDTIQSEIVYSLLGDSACETPTSTTTAAAANSADVADFTIDAEYGWLAVGHRALDRELRKTMALCVSACDESGATCALQRVTVNLLDVNDSPPRFDRAEYGVEPIVVDRRLAVEDPHFGFVADASATAEERALSILNFSVSDPDEVGQVRVFILADEESGEFANVDLSEMFAVRNRFVAAEPSSVNGTWPKELVLRPLNAAKFFTAEKRKRALRLTLIANDGPHSTAVTVKALLTLDEDAPLTMRMFCERFVEDESIVVPANLAAGHLIYVLKTEALADQLRRASGNQTLRVLNHLMDSTRFPFAVRNNSNLVVTDGFFYNPKYTLHIRVQPEGLPQMESCVQTLRVTIQNANRMAPRFDVKVVSATVKENLNVTGTDSAHYVLRLDAFDDDFGEFGRLTYTVDGDRLNASSSTPSGDSAAFSAIYRHFTLDDETGVLKVHVPLDREAHDLFEIPVRATDGGGLFADAKVLVHVEDVNDNAPEFAESVVRLKVLENEALGYQLVRVRAEDRDLDANVTYRLADETPENVSRVVAVQADGVVKLVGTLDYETLHEFRLDVVASDNGRPPLSAVCSVEVEVLDVNDNAPRFERPLYETALRESTAVSTRVVRVAAVDADSEHFGRVSYTLTSRDEIGSADYFLIADDGWLLLNRAVDYETVKALRVNVHALDGGSPPLSDDCIVNVNVLDENDNPPAFVHCNMTAVVQEGVPPGQALLSLALTDADSAANGGPFRVELSGDGATAFAVDPLFNLITAQQISYAHRREFELRVKAFDVGNLSSTCPLKVFVKQQSKYAPEVEPLLVTLNTLMGEFLGGPIGRVVAHDRDPSDLLRYRIVESTANSAGGGVYLPMPAFANRNAPPFAVNAETGELSAQPDLLPGLYRFNVSVTDGKFVVHAPVSVDVSDIDQEALDHSVSIRFKRLSVNAFVHDKMRVFYDALARSVGVSPTNIRILSVQRAPREPTTTHRFRRDANATAMETEAEAASSEEDADLDVLFTVIRSETAASRGAYYRPTFVKQRVEAAVNDISADTGLEIISLTSEVCRRDTCVRGECRDRLWLDNVFLQPVRVDSTAFVAPRHERTFECICRQGYSGRYCDVPVNKCSKELCMRHEMCIPVDEDEDELAATMTLGVLPNAAPVSVTSSPGFVCTCPPGFGGERCALPTCDEPSTCSQKAELSLMGNGFFQLFLSTLVESRMELGVAFKTISRNGVLMHGRGMGDFHELTIKNGFVEYRWDCGTGVGTARIVSARVDDGVWHVLKVSRRGRHSRLALDDRHVAEATSPPGSDVINLFRHSTMLTFGARLVDDSLATAIPTTDGGSVRIGDATVTSPEFNNLAVWRPYAPPAADDASAVHRRRRHHLFRRHRRHRLRRFAFGNTLAAEALPQLFHRDHRRETASELRMRVDGGIIGCFGRISIDGFDVSKTEQGLRLYNAAVGCDSSSMGPCLSVPCRNGAQCLPNRTQPSQYSCACPPRFTGSNCEIDLNACAGQPCPKGVPCHNLYNDFHCSCPSGFTGKTCQLRGEWDPCTTRPCGAYGTCVRYRSTFVCNCSAGFGGNFCADRIPKMEADRPAISLNSFEFYLLLGLFAAAIFLSTLAVFICQRQTQSDAGRRATVAVRKPLASLAENGTGGGGMGGHNKKRRKNDDAADPLVPRRVVAPAAALDSSADRTAPPPPLPPKFSRNAQLYQNLGGGSGGQSSATANHHGLPTVEVRPMQSLVSSESGGSGSRGNHSPLLKPSCGQQCSPSVTAAAQNALGHRLQHQHPQQSGHQPTATVSNNNNHSQRQQQKPRLPSAEESAQPTTVIGNGVDSTTPPPPPAHRSRRPNSTSRERTMLNGSGGSHPNPPHHHHHRQPHHHKHHHPDESARKVSTCSSCVSSSCSSLASTSAQHHCACASASATQNLAPDECANSRRKLAQDGGGGGKASKKTADYLTMKPIHRAKPFNAHGDAGDSERNGGSGSGMKEVPPAPPAHRNSHQSRQSLTAVVDTGGPQLYDDPIVEEAAS